MKLRRLIVLLAITLGLGFLGAKQGLAFVQAKYGAPCAKLEGFGGFLQDMNFLAQGDCAIKKGPGNKCQNNGICTVSGPSGTFKGKCNDIAGFGCTCVVN
jgi:hypothetical protein